MLCFVGHPVPTISYFFIVFRHEDSSTVYKTVDFVKTEAFNRTKKNVEQKRYNIHQ